MAKFKFDPEIVEPVPEDWYVAQVIAASDGFTRKSDPMIILTLRIIPSGRRIVTFLVFSEMGFWTVLQFCAGVGLELPEEQVEISLPREDCLWRIVYVEVAHEKFNGETRARVRRIIPREGWPTIAQNGVAECGTSIVRCLYAPEEFYRPPYGFYE